MCNVVSDSSIKSALTAHPSANLEWLALRREEIVEPELPIVDPHHHLWNLPTNRYLLDEALDDFTAGHHITHTVHVQCRSMYRADGEDSHEPDVDSFSAAQRTMRFRNFLYRMAVRPWR